MIKETIPLKGWDMVRVFRKIRTPVDDIHIIPANDLKKHDLSWDCWCKPKIQQELPPYEILHNAKDRRELKEVDYPFNTIPRA